MFCTIKSYKLFLVLTLYTGGQLVRELEILSIRYSNVSKSDYRNIFIENRIVVLVTRYYKGY